MDYSSRTNTASTTEKNRREHMTRKTKTQAVQPSRLDEGMEQKLKTMAREVRQLAGALKVVQSKLDLLDTQMTERLDTEAGLLTKLQLSVIDYPQMREAMGHHTQRLDSHLTFHVVHLSALKAFLDTLISEGIITEQQWMQRFEVFRRELMQGTETDKGDRLNEWFLRNWEPKGPKQ
jgi:hypothetical protein